LFGSSQRTEHLLEILPARYHVIAIIDNDLEKQSSYQCRIEILPPSQLIEVCFDLVIICISQYSEPRDQLLDMGISEDRIALSDTYFYKFYNDLYAQYNFPAGIEQHKFSKDFLHHYARGVDFHPSSNLITSLNRISMLSKSTLLLMLYFAKVANGRVLEIGPYVGGSTVALAKGISERCGAPVITIEKGGSYLDHPLIPSENIVNDLRSNIASYELTENVFVIEGSSRDVHVVTKVVTELSRDKIGLFFVDADGDVEADVNTYGRYFSDSCILVMDDYTSKRAIHKAVLVSKWVNEHIDNGSVESFGVLPWGTWFGRVRKNIWLS